MKGLRAKKVNVIKEGTLIVAIDIGMASNHGCCVAADGRSTKTFRFDNTRQGLDIAGTWRHIKKDGALIHVEIISHTLTFMGKRAEMVLALDITERKRMEEELILLAKISGTLPSA